MSGEGKRFNEGKVRFDLAPAFAQEQYAKVLTMGAKKYGDRNWEKGMGWSKVIASLNRHLEAIKRGEDFDIESGLLHSAHVMTNAAFLTEYYKIFPQGDDREIFALKGLRIGLDIDDVLSNFCKAYCERFSMTMPEFWNFDREFLPRLKETMEDKDFWTGLPVMTNPSDLPFEPACYITSRSIPKAWTEEWLDKNGFAAVPVYQVGVDGSKVECAKNAKLDMFVDDRYDNFVELTNAGIFTYLYSRPHNERYNVGHRRIEKLSDIVERF